MQIDSPDIREACRIVREHLKGYHAQIYLFGSRATGHATRASDIDLAVLPLVPLPRGLLSEIREALEESRVICLVDLVDLSEASEAFRQRVLKEGIPCSD